MNISGMESSPKTPGGTKHQRDIDNRLQKADSI